ncbi:MAG: hypothetical protein PHF17_08030 [Arcobacteraceae bacterium]|nr:hypothetical protein [Arcobacteraceae bacterium]
MTKQLLPPSNWDEFEQLCHGLWSELLSDSETKMHARRGQAQNGIDIYGYDHRSGTSKLIGIQCKGKDTYLDRNLTENELRDEVLKATSFQPKISKFILATTGKRDVNVQAFTRTVNTENMNAGLFSVSTWDWSDISEEIQNYPTLLRKYYPESFISPNLHRTSSSLNLILPLSHDHEQKIASLFEVDDIKCELDNNFRHEVRDFVLEISSNAYRHGEAKKLEVEIYSNRIIIKENGKYFDQILKSESMQTNTSMQGLKYIKYFLDQYKQEMSTIYEYDGTNSKNIITLNFNNPIVRIKPDKCMISFEDFIFMGRIEAQTAASTFIFHDECLVYSLHISRQSFMISSLYAYLDEIVKRLPSGKKLKIILQNKYHKEMVESWFDSKVIEVITS